jgi:tRNA pseudouridine65 synthase
MNDIENTEPTVDVDSHLSVDSVIDDQTEKPVLTILYQDEHMVAVDKPAGLFVHRSFMDKDEIYFALQLVRDQIGQYVYPVHRLDRPTSGVLLFALSKEVATILSEAFANKSSLTFPQADTVSELIFETPEKDKISSPDLAMIKTYYALVRGHLAVDSRDINSSIAIEGHTDLVRGFIDHPLKEKLDKLGDKNVSRHKPAQSAQSFYQVIEQASLPIKVGKFDSVRYSLVEVQPVTGRRHQIRRHLAHLRHPIIGDINYGDNKQNPFFIEHFGFKRLMLIAKSLEFNHPITNQRMKITASFDGQWQQVFNQLKWPLR